MEPKRIGKAALAASVFAATACLGYAAATSAARDSAVRTSESSVTTNDNGSVTRSFTECNVTTNGSLVTERRRETRTTLDTRGNVLETSTSEYAQSYSIADGAPSRDTPPREAADETAAAADSFLGLRFGETFEGDGFVRDAAEPSLLRARFEPAKKLAGFDDYYVYVTPTTHRIAKVYACAKQAVEPGARWRRHYLVEALEKRYGTWARLCSFSRPCCAFDLGDGRRVTACLAGASPDYETVLAAWDEAVLACAADEQAALVEAERKAAREHRRRRVEDAAEAF